jgi:hypothetical protein
MKKVYHLPPHVRLEGSGPRHRPITRLTTSPRRSAILIIAATLLTAVLRQNPCAAETRADHYEEALELAKASRKDIVVFQRGSDWNRLGEMLHRDVWLKDEFVEELGDGFILVAVDRPESATGAAESRIAKVTDATSPLPPNEVVAVESDAKVPFAARKDGAFLGKSNPTPVRDTLTLRLEVKGGGRVLRLDFPADSSLPSGGPGRAPNGNFCISEIVARQSGNPLAITAAWANSGRPEQGAWRAVDGIADQPDNFWNALASGENQRTLFLLLQKPLQPGGTLALQLQCLSNSKQHVPGCVRAASLDDAAMAADVLACAEAERTAALNAAYSWWDTAICPRIALLDCDGRAVACENKPRLGLTPKTMAARVKELRAIREKRDALWAAADATQGPARAELFRQSLDAMGFANWPGNDRCYAPVHDKIRAADPKDESGAVRWLTFGRDPRDGLKWAEPSWSQALVKKNPTDTDFTEALARIDRELKNPRNKVLDPERIQRIMIAKYLVYGRWAKNKDLRFGIQRDIAALDPGTFWGIGAIGDLGMHHRTETPMLTYGWAASQVKPGANIWDMADTAYFFDHAGDYKVRLNATRGKGALTVRRIAILDGTRVLSEARPAVRLGQGKATVEVDVNVNDWRVDRRLVLRVEADASVGQTDIAGAFVVEPQLPALPAITFTTTGTDEAAGLLGRGEISELQRKLDVIVSTAATKGGGASAAPDVQAALAQATVIRFCGAEKLGTIAARDGGAIFLQSLFEDSDWLESFLASGKADWPQALENLYLLRRYGEGWEQPFNQRLATALALQWGKRSAYQLVDRFAHIHRALRDGLMHASFESLDVRELRWAVYTDGTARDYQFLLDDRQTRRRDYLGAHGGIRYVSFNAYGVSVQDGWNYLAPWAHAYGGRFIIHKQVGGVCGAVSTYASVAARAHGIPSIDIGQPGHCAFVVRLEQEWPVGNSVTWPSSITAPGWDGTSYPTMNRLYEPVHQDRERFLRASRLSWLAQWQAERDKAGAKWRETYRQAIAAQPTNYGTWVEYIKLLETADDTSAATWLDLGKQAAATFSAYNEAGWALTRRCLNKALPAMQPAARMEALLACNRELRQENWYKPDGFPYEGILDWQIKSLGDPALEAELFGKLLAIHHSKNPHGNFIFGNVMSWGAKRFSGNPATASAYAKAMVAFFRAEGESLDKNLLATTLKNGIRKASEAEDIVNYRLWTDMAEKMLPPLKPQDVHLTPAHVAARPQHEPFPGLLLSRDGMLQTSSVHPDDRPLSYTQILAGGALGWFDTASDAKPWAHVVLPGDGELAGIVLVGRYEYPPSDASYKAAPLTVAVSLDGKTWTEVASFEKDEMVFRVDLQGQNLRARYVRAERVPGPQETKPFDRFHLRSFMVYGKKLY